MLFQSTRHFPLLRETVRVQCVHTKLLLEDHSHDLLRGSHCNLDLILVLLSRVLKRELVTKCLAPLAYITGRTNEKVWWCGKLLCVNINVINREHELCQF